ncbi:MAG: DUF167 family protein [Nitrospirota bacterium]|nr:DUF167 family protein [Nitrospirota bacterium]
MEPPEWVEDVSGGVRIRIRLAPRASRTAVLGAHGGALKIALTAPPVEGKANKALIAFLAKQLGVAKGAARIVSGELARDKVVQVEGVSAAEAVPRLTP